MKNNRKRSAIRLYGLDLATFTAFALIVAVCAWLGALPEGMTGALAVCIVLTAIFKYAGDHLPIIKDYLGGGAFVCVFGSSALVMFGILPDSVVEQVSHFTTNSGAGFLDYGIVVLITGSLLGVNKNSLRSAVIRYVPCILAAQLAAIVIALAAALILGLNIRETIMFTALPILGGGIGAGAVPMSQMVSDAWGISADTLLAQMTSSIALANAMAVILGGFMDKLGKIRPSWTGNGNLIAKSKLVIEADDREPTTNDFKLLGIGFFSSVVMMCAGRIMNALIPAIHAFAWMIIICCILKIFSLLPKYVEEGSHYFTELFVTNCASLILIELGIAQIDLNEVISGLTPVRFILIFCIVAGASAVAMAVGKLLGFHPIEAGITTGLCATDMGGSGDVAILGAAKRMQLLPYSAISTRIGGAIILILSGFAARLLA